MLLSDEIDSLIQCLFVQKLDLLLVRVVDSLDLVPDGNHLILQVELVVSELVELKLECMLQLNSLVRSLLLDLRIDVISDLTLNIFIS